MSDPRYNAWFSMSEAFEAELIGIVDPENPQPAVEFPELNDISDGFKEILTTVYDYEAMSSLFRVWGGKSYRNISGYIQDKPENVQAIRAEMDAMAQLYPTDFGLSGAWHYEDGRPIGMQWDSQDPPQLTGDPWYPTPSQAINFMPDIPDPASPDPENPTMIRPTEMTDVMLVAGQPARIFVMEPGTAGGGGGGGGSGGCE